MHEPLPEWAARHGIEPLSGKRRDKWELYLFGPSGSQQDNPDHPKYGPRLGLARFLADHDVALISAHYLKALNKAWKGSAATTDSRDKKGLPRMQDIPEEHIFRGEKLEAALRECDGKYGNVRYQILSVSYSWRHPILSDDGSVLHAVATTGGTSGRRSNKRCALEDNILVFWDYGSLPQARPPSKERGDKGSDDRTDREKQMFHKAQAFMMTMYGSEATNVIRLTGIGHHSGTPYSLRAWTQVETRCARLRPSSFLTWAGGRVARGSTRTEAPLAPQDFEQILQPSAVTKEHDRALLRSMYHDIFLLRAERTKNLVLEHLDHTELPALSRALEHFAKLRTLDLNRSSGILPDEEAVNLLGKALCTLPHFNYLNLQNCHVKPKAVMALIPYARQMATMQKVKIVFSEADFTEQITKSIIEEGLDGAMVRC